jgi:hypothetical protein
MQTINRFEIGSQMTRDRVEAIELTGPAHFVAQIFRENNFLHRLGTQHWIAPSLATNEVPPGL